MDRIKRPYRRILQMIEDANRREGYFGWTDRYGERASWAEPAKRKSRRRAPSFFTKNY